MEVAQLISHIHAMGLVHGDPTAENMFVTKGGIKLIDPYPFGLYPGRRDISYVEMLTANAHVNGAISATEKEAILSCLKR